MDGKPTDEGKKYVVRVLLVGKGAPDVGGIPSFLASLQYDSLATRHELSFLNLATSGRREGGRFTAGNVLRTLQDMVAVFRRARSQEVVHIHSALAPASTLARAGALAVAARAGGSRALVHGHGGLLGSWGVSPLRRIALRIALAPAHRVLVVSTPVADLLSSVLPQGSAVLIDNGVDLDRFLPAAREHSPPRVLYVGLLTPRKGVLDLLEASAMLHERGVEHEIRLVGGTPDEGKHAEDAVRSKLRPDVVVMGRRDREEMPAVYAEADVLCLPSWWEAMPLSVLEGMASGLPVVATDVGDVSRAVAHGRTGLLVEPRSPRALSDALEQVLGDRAAAQEMGRRGREAVVQRFSIAATCRLLDDEYADARRRRR